MNTCFLSRFTKCRAGFLDRASISRCIPGQTSRTAFVQPPCSTNFRESKMLLSSSTQGRQTITDLSKPNSSSAGVESCVSKAIQQAASMMNDGTNSKIVEGGETVSDTPLARKLRQQIQVRGPISVADWMRATMTDPEHGYYVNKEEVLGQKGDFITAPEISQMFGEMVGIWFVNLWMQMRGPRKFRMVELGPGKGTLMADLTRVFSQFPDVFKALSGIDFVESSHALSKQQLQTLKDRGAALPDNVTVQWLASVDEIKCTEPIFVVAQEFVDALPVHQFVYSENKRMWSEVMVDVESSTSGEPKFKLVKANGKTLAASTFLSPHIVKDLPSDPKDGDMVEVCPDAQRMLGHIQRLVSQQGGGFLMFDYGALGNPAPSVQALYKHERADILDRPGQVDLTAHVDFGSLCLNLQAGPKVNIFGPLTQGEFLQNMGMQERLAALKNACKSDERRHQLDRDYRRLVGANEMGQLFKCMAFSHKAVDGSAGFVTQQ